MDYRTITVENTILKVYVDGTILRLKNDEWKMIENTPNHKKGYNVIMIEKKQYMRSRIVCYAYNKIELKEKKVIHHLDNNRLNCHVDNLTIETHQTLTYYKINEKGWKYDSLNDKYNAIVFHNNKLYNIGSYDTDEEAHYAYLNFKYLISLK